MRFGEEDTSPRTGGFNLEGNANQLAMASSNSEGSRFQEKPAPPVINDVWLGYGRREWQCASRWHR